MISKYAALVGSSLIALSVATPVLAQEEQVVSPTTPAASVSNTVVYDQSFFARYSTNTAEDMLRRIPGVPAILDTNTNQGQDRGFGSGGSQILIAGRRFPGKSNEITATLRRIPASSIERVELIRGASDDIDVQSKGIVVNLIMKPGASIGGSGSYELNARFNDHDYLEFDGLVSYSKTYGALTYSLGLERNVWSPVNAGNVRWTRRTRSEAYFYPNGAPQELRPQVWDRFHHKWIYTGALTYDLPNSDRINLNALYETRVVDERDETLVTRYSPTGVETLRARELHDRLVDPNLTLELSGEYTSGIGPGNLSALWILGRQRSPSIDFRTRFEPTRTVEVSRSEAVVKTGEDILRASYSLPVMKGQTLELGGEGARNTLKQDLQAFFDLDRNGTLEPIVIPIAKPQVKELRGELFAKHKWTVTDKLSLDSSLNYEYSKLTTNYPGQPARTLGFIKPRFDARYKPSTADQLRLLAERTISQLDFANFVPAYNLLDDRVDAGNPGLEPEKTWHFEAGYERRLPRDGGLLEARAFYDDITDAIDKAPLRDRSGFLYSAQGNLDKAKRYGIEGKASVRLSKLGLRDAVFSIRALKQWSETTDPFTGDKRRLRDDRQYGFDIGFRHDVTPLRMSYGFNYKDFGLTGISQDLTSVDYFLIRPTLEAFAERQIFRATTIRLEVQNIAGGEERRRRIQYVTNAFDGTPRRLDQFLEKRDLRFALRLRGRF